MKYLKEYIIIFIILLFIILAEIITVKITNNSIKIIYDDIADLEKDIKEKKTDDTLENFFKDWEKIENSLALYLEHNEIEKISTVVRNLKTNMETDNYLNVDEQLGEIKFRLYYLKNKQRVNLKNIF